MTRMTGDQARELLDGTTPGPWDKGPGMGDPEEWTRIVYDLKVEDGFITSTVLADVSRDEDADLFASAPALAETVAWLYGQTGQDYDGDWQLDHHDPYYQYATVGPDGEGRISLAVGPYGQEIRLDPDEAVEVARALLTAAESARAE